MEPQRTSLERRVLTGTGLQIAARIASAFCSASAIVLIGRHLGDEGLGRFNFHFTLFLIVGALVDLGSMSIAVREVTRRPDREREVIRAIFRIRLATTALCIAICCSIAWWKEGSGWAAWLPMIASLHLLAVAPGAAAAWLQARVQLTAIAVAPIAGFGLYLGAAVALARADVHEPGLFLVAFGLGMTVQALVPWLAARKEVQLTGPTDRALVRELFFAMLPLGISAAVSTLYFRMDALLLNHFWGDQANGRYARTFPMLSLSIALPTYLSSAIFPALTRASGQGAAQVARLVRRAAAVLAGFALPAAAMCFSWGGQILWLFWARHGHAEPLAEFIAKNRDLMQCVPALAIAAIAIFLTYPQMHALTALGRQRVLVRITLLALAAKLVVSGVAIRSLGVPGAALGTAITETGVLAMVSLEVKRATGAFALSRQLVRPLLVALPVGVIAALIPNLSPLWTVPAAIVLEGMALAAAGALPLRLGIDE